MPVFFRIREDIAIGYSIMKLKTEKQYLTILEYILNYFDFVMGKNSLFYCPGKGE